MIEPMLEAERALAVGLLDNAERLYRQVIAADPNNSIAVVGLARVALERGDERTTYLEARRALSMDPDNPMASHLVMRMAEIMRGRGEEPPMVSAAETPVAETPVAELPAAGPPGANAPAKNPPEGAGRGLVDRFLRRRR
jgi:thioredoxin-like negative regulator of GroEL